MRIISLQDTILKISYKHSSLLSESEKCLIKKGEIFEVIKEINNHYMVKRINSEFNKNWFVNKNHFKYINNINLIYFKLNKNYGNFGDELSKFITQSLVNKDKYYLTFNKKKKNTNLLCIGSYIHAAKNDSYIFGSGVRTMNNIEKGHKYSNLNVLAIRGPLSKSFLEARGIYVPNIYGDPALLLPKYYKPIIKLSLSNKIGIVPHKSNYEKYIDKYDKNKFYLINPTDKWQNVINYICSCKAIISSSLHGLICSDAYNIPNIWLDEYKLTEGHFKFKDYFLSQNRKFLFIKNINEYQEDLLYSNGNNIDLNKLEKSFIFK